MMVGGVDDISELAARILSELEEAGAENFSSTVNTVTVRRGDEREIRESVEAVRELVRSGFAVLRQYREQKLSKEASIEILTSVASSVSFDSDERLWKWGDKLPLIEIVATEEGRSLAFEILDERGYQWWRQKS